jgi:hypothetical protein
MVDEPEDWPPDAFWSVGPGAGTNPQVPLADNARRVYARLAGILRDGPGGRLGAIRGRPWALTSGSAAMRLERRFDEGMICPGRFNLARPASFLGHWQAFLEAFAPRLSAHQGAHCNLLAGFKSCHSGTFRYMCV